MTAMHADPLNVLLVEDNEDDFLIVRDLLRDVYAERLNLEWVETYEEGLGAIRAQRHDLILLDFRLSHRTGLELLEETRSVSPRAPMILMTGQGDHDIDVQAMQAGATDYLVKDHLDADLLERAIRYAVERQKSAEALRASEDRYRTFVENSTEGIWRFELEKPLPTDRPEEEQIAHLERHAYLAECNEAMAHIYGYEHASEIIGSRFAEFLSTGDGGDDNHLRRLIHTGYRMVNTEAFELDRRGQPKYVLHNLIGVVENGLLYRIWGSQNDITERKRAELAQAQLAAIVEASADAIISTTLDGLIATWNKGAEALYGYTAQEVTGQPASCVVPADRSEEVSDILDCTRRGAGVPAFDTVRLDKGGRRIDVSLAVSPILDTFGHVIGSSSIARDISEQKRAETRLRQSEANMAAAQRIAHFGSWEIELGNGEDVDANPLRWSDETFRIFGYEPGSVPVTNELFFNAVPLEDRPAIRQAVAAAVAQRDDYSVLHRVLRPDGGERIVRETAKLLNGEEAGQSAKLIGTVHDVTEQQRAEELIRFNALLLSQVRNAVVATDLAGQIIYWNGFAETLYQWKSEEVIGRNVAEVTSPPENQALAEQVMCEIRETGSWQGEWLARRKDGSTFHAYVVDTLFQDANGLVAGLVGVSIDITERKQAEDALRQQDMIVRIANRVTHTGGWALDLSDQRLYWSDEIFDLLEYPHGAVPPLAEALALYPDPWRDKITVAIKRCAEDGVPFDVEVEILTGQGKKLWVRVCAEAERHADGSIKRVQGAFQDITDRKDAEAERLRMEEALRISEHRLRLTLESGKFGTYDLDLLSGLYHEISGTGRAQFALPAEGAISIGDWVQRVKTEDLDELQDTVARAASVREPDFDSDYRIVLPEGDVRWISVHGTLIYDDAGLPIRMLGVTQDISQRKQAEALLTESRQRLELATESAQIGIWDWNVATNTMLWDAQMFALYGIRAQDFSGAYDAWQHGLHPEDRDQGEAEISLALDGSRDFHTQFRVVWPGGEVRHIEAHAVVQRASDGSAFRMTGVNWDITERKQAEAAMQEAEREQRHLAMRLEVERARLTEAQALAKVGSWELDLVTNALTWSDENHRIFGSNPAQFQGSYQAFLENVHPDDRAAVNEAFLASVINQTPYAIDHRIRLDDGRIKFVHEQCRTFYDEEGRPIRSIGTTQDITTRKEAEAERDRIESALRQSEQRFRGVVDKVESLVIHDQEGRLIDVNQNACDSLGYTRDELLRLRVPDYELRYEQAKIARLWEQMAAGEISTLIVDGLHQRKDGSTFPVEVRVGLMETDGRPLMVAVARDVTDRKLAEEERDRFFTLSLDMLAIIGSDGYIKRLNPAFESTLGYSEAELMAKPFLEFVHPDDIPATLAQMAILDGGNQGVGFENRYVCRDGSYKWLRWMTAPYGGLWYAVAHDVTAIKQAEAALHQANDDLERRVAERTTQLENSHLEMSIAKEEAERANAAKSEFLSRMSHELRTPMNSILGFTQIMEMDEPTEKQSVRLGHIMRSGQHLLKLINEVLDTARVESGRLELSTEPVSLSKTLQTAAEMIRPLCQPRDQRLICDWAAWESLYVKADQQRLSQVMINLLSNAAKFNRDGGVILVQCQQCAEGRLRVSISDSGGGISAGQIEKLFQPFERLEADRGPIEGTGLGLSLSKRLIELMGGTIGVESVVGTGSTFWVELPLADGPLQAIQSLPPRSLSPLIGSFTLLCIEDNPANLQVIEHILLSQPQYQLLSARSGTEGLEIARSNHPSLILLDLHLPDLPGSEVLSRLQNDPETRDIPVVIVSADATVIQIRRLRAAGAAEYLTKPINVDLFLDVLHDTMKKATSQKTEDVID